MALIAMTTSDVVEYVSDLDPSKKKKYEPIDPARPELGEIETPEIGQGATVFGLKPLDVFLMGWIYDNASELEGNQGSTKVGIKTRINQTNIDAVRFGLAWVRNFQTKEGKQLRFSTTEADVNGRKYQAASDEVMNSMGVRLIQELADQIKKISEVTADEEKNSAGAQLQSV